MRTHEFAVQENAIHCEGCESRIANALKRVPGVRNVRASAATQRVRVTADDSVARAQLEERLRAIGYPTGHA